MHFAKYLKTAFLNQWNLLAFLGAAGFALLSGQPDVLLPLVLAGECAYLGLLAAHPKFQKYVDAHQAQSRRAEYSRTAEQALSHILRRLPADLLKRYESLRGQCLELRHIAMDLKQPGLGDAPQPLEELQMAGLDRLLWVYLRLLYTLNALTRFLEKTSEEGIQSKIKSLQQRIAGLPDAQPGTSGERVRKALADNLETSLGRLANLEKARENHQIVLLEIDRLENKIRSLSEMAVNRQEPEFISNQVDQVASSMLETERTMNDLQFATGLETLDNQAPQLLRDKATQTQR
ncbi:MAG: hypothetical protein NTW96_10240 [Planctomycetia bacterium]|nr:hypothetical protein [Planctomycetia bacterium]